MRRLFGLAGFNRRDCIALHPSVALYHCLNGVLDIVDVFVEVLFPSILGMFFSPS